MSKPTPHTSMPVVYRAIGGAEVAAIITEVRKDGCSLTLFYPHSALLFVSRIPFVAYHLDSDAESICYPPIGYETKAAG